MFSTRVSSIEYWVLGMINEAIVITQAETFHWKQVVVKKKWKMNESRTIAIKHGSKWFRFRVFFFLCVIVGCCCQRCSHFALSTRLIWIFGLIRNNERIDEFRRAWLFDRFNANGWRIARVLIECNGIEGGLIIKLVHEPWTMRQTSKNSHQWFTNCATTNELHALIASCDESKKTFQVYNCVRTNDLFNSIYTLLNMNSHSKDFMRPEVYPHHTKTQIIILSQKDNFQSAHICIT